MSKYLLPGAVVLAALIGSFTFRYDVQPVGGNGVAISVHDRWWGRIALCVQPSSGDTKCAPDVSTARLLAVAEERGRKVLDTEIDRLARDILREERLKEAN